MLTKDGPLWLVLASVGTGAALGAMLRWALSSALNPLQGWMPWGTLAANGLGGFLMGLVFAWLSSNPTLAPALRLFLVTGFLGGLTTFSTFSLEAVSLLEAGTLARALLHIGSHLALSLAGTWAGWRLLKAWL